MTKFDSFDATIASAGYHVYKETSWSNAKVGDAVKVKPMQGLLLVILVHVR